MRFSGSKAFSESFAIFGNRFAPMAVIAAIFTFLPLVIFFGFFVSQLPALATAGSDPTAMLNMIAGMVGQLLLVMLVYIAVRALGSLAMCIAAADNKGSSVGDAIGEGARSLLPMLGVFLLLFVAYIALAVIMVVVIGASFAGILSGSSPPSAGSGFSIFLLMLALFGLIIWLAVKLSMVLPVIALDKERNPINAISRSWTLTNGATFKMFLVFLLSGLCAAVISGVVNAMAGNSMLDPTTTSGGGFFAGLIVSMLVSTAISMYFTALIVAIHRQLAGPTTGEVTETFS